jgi:hypothetical protein
MTVGYETRTATFVSLYVVIEYCIIPLLTCKYGSLLTYITLVFSSSIYGSFNYVFPTFKFI